MSRKSLDNRCTGKGGVVLKPFALASAPFRVLMVALWALVGLSDVQAQDCVEQGKEYLQEARIADALASFDGCKQADQEDAAAYFYTGIALAAEGNLVEAVIELEKAAELDPDEVEYALGFADILSGVGQWAAAEEVLGLFDQEDKIDQLETAQLWLLSDLYYRAEKFEQAGRNKAKLMVIFGIGFFVLIMSAAGLIIAFGDTQHLDSKCRGDNSSCDRDCQYAACAELCFDDITWACEMKERVDTPRGKK